jgi:hypothetical protein
MNLRTTKKIYDFNDEEIKKKLGIPLKEHLVRVSRDKYDQVEIHTEI